MYFFFIDEQIFYFNKPEHVHTVFFFQQKPSSRPKQS